jgi:hypothetical protein
MVKRGDCLITSVENGTADELFLEALHCEKRGNKKYSKRIENKQKRSCRTNDFLKFVNNR